MPMNAVAGRLSTIAEVPTGADTADQQGAALQRARNIVQPQRKLPKNLHIVGLTRIKPASAAQVKRGDNAPCDPTATNVAKLIKDNPDQRISVYMANADDITQIRSNFSRQDRIGLSFKRFMQKGSLEFHTVDSMLQNLEQSGDKTSRQAADIIRNQQTKNTEIAQSLLQLELLRQHGGVSVRPRIMVEKPFGDTRLSHGMKLYVRKSDSGDLPENRNALRNNEAMAFTASHEVLTRLVSDHIDALDASSTMTLKQFITKIKSRPLALDENLAVGELETLAKQGVGNLKIRDLASQTLEAHETQFYFKKWCRSVHVARHAAEDAIGALKHQAASGAMTPMIDDHRGDEAVAKFKKVYLEYHARRYDIRPMLGADVGAQVDAKRTSLRAEAEAGFAKDFSIVISSPNRFNNSLAVATGQMQHYNDQRDQLDQFAILGSNFSTAMALGPAGLTRATVDYLTENDVVLPMDPKKVMTLPSDLHLNGAGHPITTPLTHATFQYKNPTKNIGAYDWP